MKKFISNIQNLSRRAAELQQAMKSAPPKFAELRDAVALTTDQLKRLKTDVQTGLADLKADNESHLLDSLLEINASVSVFHQAGYDLGGVDMELSPVHRLIVHLNRVEDVPLSTLRSLATSNQHRKVTRALLTSLIQAEETADQVDLANLVYYKLLVSVGPIPSVRLCWRPEAEAMVAEQAPVQTPVQAAMAAETPSLSSYGKGSFFAPHSQAPAQPEVPEVMPTAESPAPEEEPSVPAPAAATSEPPPITAARAEHKSYRSGGKDWGASSLERFKKMPTVSKYRR